MAGAPMKPKGPDEVVSVELTRREAVRAESETERFRSALEKLADLRGWDESPTGHVTWLYPGGGKPWEIAKAALGSPRLPSLPPEEKP